MKDTALAPIPVRFRFAPGGTDPAAVADIVDALQDLMAPHMLGEELRRAGLEQPALPTPPADPADQPTPPAEPADPTDPAAPADQTDPTDPTDPTEPVQPVKTVLVPLEPGTDIQRARRALISRLAGPLPARTSLIMQTSGSTTDNGHLVAISGSALVSAARSTSAALGRPGRWILALPANHIAGLQVLARSILAGTRPVIVNNTKGFKPAALARAIRRATEDPNVPAYLSLVPTQLSMILDEGGECVEALRSLEAILVGGAALTPYLRDRALAVGAKIVTTYGMTETCGGCVYDGRPLAGVQVAAVGGQVLISGTVLMEGYLEKPGPEAEDPFIYMGMRKWLRTQDTGRMEGPRLVIQGRADDVINTGGVKVHASAVEQSAANVGGVGEVCVVGLPDARWGEVVTAVVVPAKDVDVDLLAPLLGSSHGLPASDAPAGGLAEPDSLAARIRTAVTAELGPAHAPRIVAIVPLMPRLGSGKTDRREVAALAGRELRAGRAWVR